MRILHLADRDEWDRATAVGVTGTYRRSTRGLDLDEVGYLHACTRGQLPGVVRRFYADADLTAHVVLVIDVGLCEAAGTPVRWEPVGDDRFPHLYGPLPLAAVVATVHPVPGDGGIDTAALARELTGLDVLVHAP